MRQKLEEHIDDLQTNMFATRDTFAEAYEYAIRIAEATGDNKPHVITAIHVLMNTEAKVLQDIIDKEYANV